jgi:hypothetical protein
MDGSSISRLTPDKREWALNNAEDVARLIKSPEGFPAKTGRVPAKTAPYTKD